MSPLHGDPSARPSLLLVRRFRLAAIILLLVWPLTACTSWRSLPAPQTGLGRNVDHVTVRTPAGQEMAVWYPEVRGDSLYGAATQQRKGHTDIRLGSLQTLEIRRFSAGRTVLLVTAIGVGVCAVALVIIAATWSPMSMGWGAGFSSGCGSCQ
jgi:hypothetical protein